MLSPRLLTISLISESKSVNGKITSFFQLVNRCDCAELTISNNDIASHEKIKLQVYFLIIIYYVN